MSKQIISLVTCILNLIRLWRFENVFDLGNNRENKNIINKEISYFNNI